MQKCPGQDSRYWGPEDVVEAECGSCGRMVEFFKTDGARRCPGCGARAVNPAVRMGCALWCEYARECLGFDPESVKMQVESDRSESVTGQIIASVIEELKGDEHRISHAIQVLENAEKILQKEKASPAVTLAAALLHDTGAGEAGGKYDSSAPPSRQIEGPPIARRILENLHFSEEDIEHVCRIAAHHHGGMPVETPEFRIVRDADWLVHFPEVFQGDDERERVGRIEEVFRTEAGKKLAMNRFVSRSKP